ncbi:hypothetical protein HDU76_010514, partial [Blyttiomyces sp. JEL0837]
TAPTPAISYPPIPTKSITSTGKSTIASTATQTATTTLSFPAPTPVSISCGTWNPIGCLFDNQSSTFSVTLSNPSDGSTDSWTIERCLSVATAYGYNLAGLANGGQCRVDTAFRNTTNVSAPANDCNLPCKSNKANLCGNVNRMSAYTLANHNYAAVLSKTTTGMRSNYITRTSIKTSTKKPTSTSSAKFIAKTSSTTKKATSSSSFKYGYTAKSTTMMTTRNTLFKTTTTVKGGYTTKTAPTPIISTPKRSPSNSTSINMIAMTVTTCTTTQPTTTPLSIPSPTPVFISCGTWNPIGCLFDNQPSPFSVTLSNPANGSTDPWTIERCVSVAAAYGYNLAGLQNGGQCHVDTAFRNTTQANAPATDCNLPCKLNKTQMCGNVNRLSAYTLAI